VSSRATHSFPVRYRRSMERGGVLMIEVEVVETEEVVAATWVAT
jgi:hypothetical protein